jgi:hypothetical protein
VYVVMITASVIDEQYRCSQSIDIWSARRWRAEQEYRTIWKIACDRLLCFCSCCQLSLGITPAFMSVSDVLWLQHDPPPDKPGTSLTLPVASSRTDCQVAGRVVCCVISEQIVYLVQP